MQQQAKTAPGTSQLGTEGDDNFWEWGEGRLSQPMSLWVPPERKYCRWHLLWICLEASRGQYTPVITRRKTFLFPQGTRRAPSDKQEESNNLWQKKLCLLCHSCDQGFYQRDKSTDATYSESVLDDWQVDRHPIGLQGAWSLTLMDLKV